MTNVGLGLSIFSSQFSKFGDLTLLWLFVAYIIFNVILHIVLSALLKVCTYTRKDTKKDGFAVKLESNGEVKISDVKDGDKKDKEDEKKRKEPSADSIYRWLGLGLYVTVTAVVILALVVLVALQ